MNGQTLSINHWIAMSYTLAILVLLIVVGSWDGLLSLLFGIVAFFWATSPVVSLALRPFARRFVGISATILGLGGLYIYWQGFFGPDLDAQSGLLLLFVPLYQWLFAGVVIVIARLISKWTKA